MAVEVKIKKSYGEFQLDVEFQSGSRRLGILGASGCGKSLTLKSIAGIERPDAGKISINGRVLFDSRRKLCLKPQVRNAGYLFQDYALFPTMTVEENIAAGLKGRREEKKKRIDGLVKKFQLEGLEKRFPGKLSGGQKQRTALARILASEPDVILLDEPFSALDAYLRDQMQREFLSYMEDFPGILILVSHSRDEIYRFSEDVLILDEGRVKGQGPAKELFADPGNAAAARVTGCKNISPVSRTGAGTYRSEMWGITFPEKTPDAEEEWKLAGIRAHRFCLQKPETPCLEIPVLDPVVTEDLFEYTVSFRAFSHAGRLVWNVSRYVWDGGKEAVPQKLYLKLEDILWLRE